MGVVVVVVIASSLWTYCCVGLMSVCLSHRECCPGLSVYLRSDADLVGMFLQRLRSIESWFTSQSSLRFIASSLLFVYTTACQATPLASRPSTNHSAAVPASSSQSGDCSWSESRWSGCVDVRMIDFTHVFETTTHDDNYLTGLRSLISYMSQLLHTPQAHSASSPLRDSVV